LGELTKSDTLVLWRGRMKLKTAEQDVLHEYWFLPDKEVTGKFCSRPKLRGEALGGPMIVNLLQGRVLGPA